MDTSKIIILCLAIFGLMMLAYFIGKVVSVGSHKLVRGRRKYSTGIAKECNKAGVEIKELVDSGEIMVNPLLFKSVLKLAAMVDGVEKVNVDNLVTVYTALYSYCISEKGEQFNEFANEELKRLGVNPEEYK